MGVRAARRARVNKGFARRPQEFVGWEEVGILGLGVASGWETRVEWRRYGGVEVRNGDMEV